MIKRPLTTTFRINWRLLTLVASIVCAAGPVDAHPPDGNTAAVAKKANSTEPRAQALLESARKTVVQIISIEDDGTVRFCVTGVLISAEGHVLSRGYIPSGDRVTVRFSDGRTVSAIPLGRSSEWRIGIWRILDEEVWPYVELGSTADTRVGQPLLLINYETNEKSDQYQQLVVRHAEIKHVDPTKWFLTTGVGAEFESLPIFTVDGRLMGFATSGFGGIATQKIATAVEIVAENLADLVAGKNLDWVRYPPREGTAWRPDYGAVEEPPAQDETGSMPDLADAKKIARETTVRIISKSRLNYNQSGNERWSGVIVSREGHILTCGHSEPLPGEQVTVQLSDGRNFNGVVLGSNWVSDIALIKITDRGVWQVAQLTESSVLQVGDPVVYCGYPAMTADHKLSTNRTPVVSATRVRLRQPYRTWRNQLPMTYDGNARGGMSGGGVFDSRGRYVGILEGPDTAIRSEFAKLQWGYLASEEPSKSSESVRATSDAK